MHDGYSDNIVTKDAILTSVTDITEAISSSRMVLYFQSTNSNIKQMLTFQKQLLRAMIFMYFDIFLVKDCKYAVIQWEKEER